MAVDTEGLVERLRFVGRRLQNDWPIMFVDVMEKLNLSLA